MDGESVFAPVARFKEKLTTNRARISILIDMTYNHDLSEDSF